jgi:hypothetical protein
VRLWTGAEAALVGRRDVPHCHGASDEQAGGGLRLLRSTGILVGSRIISGGFGGGLGMFVVCGASPGSSRAMSAGNSDGSCGSSDCRRDRSMA